MNSTPWLDSRFASTFHNTTSNLKPLTFIPYDAVRQQLDLNNRRERLLPRFLLLHPGGRSRLFANVAYATRGIIGRPIRLLYHHGSIPCSNLSMSVIECCLDDCLYAGNIIILVCDVKLCVPSYHSPNPAVVGTESNTVTPDWACLPLGYGSKLGGTVDARICWDVDKRLEDTNIAVAQMIVEFSQNRLENLYPELTADDDDQMI